MPSSSHLECLGDGLGTDARQGGRVARERACRIRRQRAAREEREACDREAFGAGERGAGARFAVAPRGAGSGVEQHAGNDQVDAHPGAFEAHGLGRKGAALRKAGPAVDATRLEMPPTAVVRHAEARIALANHLRDVCGGGGQAFGVPREMGGLSGFDPGRDLAAVLANRACGEQPRCRGGSGVVHGRRGHALDHFDALLHEGPVLHVAHRGPAVDARDPEPMEHIGHQLLEAHVLHARHAFGAGEIRLGAVAAGLALARVVDQELGDFAQRAPFLAVVDHQADAALLRHLDADFDAVREIGAAGADVGAEHVRPIALVVQAAGDARSRIAEARHVAEEIDGHAADRRQEDLQVRARDELGEHARGLLEEGAPQRALLHLEALGEAGEVPHGVDRRLGDLHVAGVGEDVAVGLEAPGRDGGAQLRHVDMGARDRDRRAHVGARGDLVGECARHEVPPRIERDDLGGIGPLRVRAHRVRRRGVREVRPVVALQLARSHGERAVDRVGARMRADGIALRGIGEACDDRTALGRRGRAPADVEEGPPLVRARMRREDDVVGGRAAHAGQGSRFIRGSATGARSAAPR